MTDELQQRADTASWLDYARDDAAETLSDLETAHKYAVPGSLTQRDLVAAISSMREVVQRLAGIRP